MKTFFITGNKKKFDEMKTVLPFLEQLDIDLPEIQEIDPHVIVRNKLREALNHKEGEFIIEDTSVYLDCLNGLPGPLIKWFLATIGNEGLVEIAEKLGNDRAEAKTIIGYAKNREEVHFFEGSVKGKIRKPKPGSGFGWDPVFQPDGYEQTFGEMGLEEKNKISMRTIAATKFKEFLEQK